MEGNTLNDLLVLNHHPEYRMPREIWMTLLVSIILFDYIKHEINHNVLIQNVNLMFKQYYAVN